MLQGQEDRSVLQQEAERVQKMAGFQQVRTLKENLDTQVLRMFKAIHAARKIQTDPANLCEIYGQSQKGSNDENDPTPQHPQHYQEVENWHPPKGARGRQQASMHSRGGTGSREEYRGRADVDSVRKALRQQLGFTLRRGPSTIPMAGEGIFLEGRVRIGTMVGLYPGLVYLQEHVRKPEEVAQLFPDPDMFLFQRYDRVMVDGRAAEEQQPNEYALAHLCNHGKPNVMALAYDFAQDPLDWGGFPKELRPYIPNSYTRPRSLLGSPDQSALMQSVVLLTTTDVEDGEELLLNYRLNPKHGKESLPSWYVPVDVEEDSRRWA